MRNTDTVEYRITSSCELGFEYSTRNIQEAHSVLNQLIEHGAAFEYYEDGVLCDSSEWSEV